MTNKNQTFLAKSADAFAQPATLSLADVKTKVESDNDINPRRGKDILSALSRVEKFSKVPLAKIPATPAGIRELFNEELTPVTLDVKPKTYANIKALVVRAVRRYGAKATQLTRRIPPAPAWQTVLDRVHPDYVRQGLYRLAAYGTVMGISPHEVSSETLLGLHAALEAEELVKRPRSVLKITIGSWNRCARTIEGWPQIILSTPFKKIPITIPLDQFPLEFQYEIQKWARGLLEPDILDDFGPGRALRKITVDSRILQIRQYASGLVSSGKLRIDEVNSLANIFQLENFKAGMRYFLNRHGGETTLRIYNLANNLRLIAKHHCRFGEDELEALWQVCKRLAPRNRHKEMTEKNRERLKQFDSHANVLALLYFPEKQFIRAIKERNKIRAAKAMELAIAIDLLLHGGLRLRTLRMIEITDFDFKSGLKSGTALLKISQEKTKTDRSLEFELPADTATRLQKFINEYRSLLPGSDGTYLFPGIAGGCRSKNAMYEMIRVGLKKHTGLIMNPHLMRHTIAKIAMKQDQNAEGSVSRLFDHTNQSTTRTYYVDRPTKIAGQHLDKLLLQAKEQSVSTKAKTKKAPSVVGGYHD